MRRLLKTLLLFALIGAARADTPLSAQGQFLPGLVFPWSRPFVQAKPCPYVNPAQCWKQTDAMGVYWAFQDIQSYLGVDGGNIPIPAKGPQATLKTELSGWVNVKSYGAKGDGTTDDTGAIQAGVNAAAALGPGAIVYAPPGVYVMTSVQTYAGVTLQGAGRDVTVFRLKPGITSANYTVDGSVVYGGLIMFWNHYSAGSPVSGIGFRDFTIDGNYANQTLTNTAWGIGLNKVTRVSVVNVRATGMLTHGIWLNAATQSVIRQSIADYNGQSSGGGDGIVLRYQATDNLVIDSIATNNGSIGFEDEGRQANTPAYRNARNRWVNLHATSNGDHNYLSLFTDHANYENCTSVGGSTNGFKLTGTANATLRDVRVTGAGLNGIYVSPEVYGSYGTNSDLTIDGATILDAGAYSARFEQVQRAKLSIRARGAVGHAISFITTPSSDIELDADVDGTVPAAYATGQAYTVGTLVSQGGNVYILQSAFTGTGLSVTAPTGTDTSADNGGTWYYVSQVHSQPQYAIYAYNPTRLTLQGGNVKNCASHNVWIDGTAAGATGLNVFGLQSTGSAARSLFVTASVLTGSNSRAVGNTFTGSVTQTDLSPFTYAESNVGVAFDAIGAGYMQAPYFNATSALYTVNSGNAATLKGHIADSSSAVANALDNYSTLSTTGAKQTQFLNNGTEIASIRKVSNAWGFRIQSPDGTWYIVTVANGGTLTVTANP